MNILMTGGTGFIGSALSHSLIARGHKVTVLSRDPNKAARLLGAGIDTLPDLGKIPPEKTFDAIVNLAGAPIFDKRWSEARKQVLLDSRVGLTERLVEWMSKRSVKPGVLISGSAVGFYGDQGDTVLTEQSPARDDFAHVLCERWEQSALHAEQLGVRVCLIRTGLVLAHGGGILQRMLLPFRFGLGGRLGDGRQWMSWIHRNDWIDIAQTLLTDTTMSGPFNATAPSPVINGEFTKVLARCLNRPALLPVPAPLLKTVLGEMAALVLGSQRVMPQRLLDRGFEFQFTDLEAALRHALSAK
ncbi:MAG: TIGR01777 family oxidoreductase [Gammaproteobacteria bacterium]